MKARICAILLAVSVVFSGMPATDIFAAQITPEEEVTEVFLEDYVSEEDNDTEITEESKEAELLQEEDRTADIQEKSPVTDTDSTMACGSNGKMYEGVSYLSVKTVDSLPKDAREAYYDMCDNIAEMMESGIELVDASIKADKNSVTIEYGIPAQALFTKMSQVSSKLEENISTEKDSLIEGEIEEFNTLMINKNYYKEQLDSYAKSIYNAGMKSLIQKGTNKINVSYNGYVSLYDEHLDAVSALVCTYPNKFNWMHLGGKVLISSRGVYYYATRKSVYNFTINKSKHYSANLEKRANAVVKDLVDQAYKYAKDYYPDRPTYGIVKYFNDWICNKNYYENAGTDSATYGKEAIYFYCHSCYGALLEGYAVCESYALAMTRLLDAAGIRNIYVVGDAGGGHAWNYVQMPDGEWYMVDSTWNDNEYSDVWDRYLLVANDGLHVPTGKRFVRGNSFYFYPLAYDDYDRSYEEELYLNVSDVVLKPGEKYQLAVNSEYDTSDYYKNYKQSWRSSNPGVAKVSKKGKITAGNNPGIAEISCTIAGKTVSCTVYVYKFKGIKFTDNYKSKYKLNYINEDGIFTYEDEQTVTLYIEQKNQYLDADTISTAKRLINPKVKSNKQGVVEVTDITFSGDTIEVKYLPKKYGTANITVSFAGKKATLTVKVKKP